MTHTERSPMTGAPLPLTESDLETILVIARNGQSGRITDFEIKALVAAYKQLHGLR